MLLRLGQDLTKLLQVGLYIHIYIYIYMCVCMCLYICVYIYVCDYDDDDTHIFTHTLPYDCYNYYYYNSLTQLQYTWPTVVYRRVVLVVLVVLNGDL